MRLSESLRDLWRWAVTPSGPDIPGCPRWLRWLWDAPLPAHALGGLAVVGFLMVDHAIAWPWVVVWRAFGAGLAWQLLNVEDWGWYDRGLHIPIRVVVPTLAAALAVSAMVLW